MPEKTDPETQDIDWVSLTKAFNDIGRMKFGVKWDEDTILLSPGAFRLETPDEALPLRIDYSIRDNHPEDWCEYLEDLPAGLRAPEEMIRHYDETKELLLDAIWKGEIKVDAIASDGALSDVPKEAWKDRTGAFKISFPDSEIYRFKPKSSAETWRIRIDSNDLQTFVEKVDAERRSAVRTKAANENPDEGGRPFKYDWPMIEQYIAEELKKSPKNVSNSKIARRVATWLEDKGIDPPHDSQLRAAVKRVREAS